MTTLFEPLRELGGCGGLTGTLQSGHQDDGRRLGGGAELGDVFAEDGDELVVDDFRDLLAGRQGSGDLGADGLDADVLDEGFDDGEVDVGLDEGEANLGHGVGDVFVGDGALAAEVFEGALELIGECFKHGVLSIDGSVAGDGRAKEERKGREGKAAKGAEVIVGWVGAGGNPSEVRRVTAARVQY